MLKIQKYFCRKLQPQGLLIPSLQKDQLNFNYQVGFSQTNSQRSDNQKYVKIFSNQLIGFMSGINPEVLNALWNIFIDVKQTFKSKNTTIDLDKQFYDIIIHPNSIYQLIQQGWYIYQRGENQPMKYLKENSNTYVSVLGNFNRGKSWILQELALAGGTQMNIGVGYTVRTKGIGVKIDQKNKLVFFDTEGFDTPINVKEFWSQYQQKVFDNKEYKMNEINKQQQQELNRQIVKQQAIDKNFNEKLIQQFVVDNSQLLLLVVDQLTQQDQKLIHYVCKDYKASKNIFIIHNLKNVSTFEDIDKCIEEHIKGNFNVTEEIIDLQIDQVFNTYSYQIRVFQDKDFSEEGKNSVKHIILANNDSKEGKLYNKYAMQKLLQIIKHAAAKFEFDLLKKFKTTTDAFYQHYLDYKSLNQSSEQDSSIIEEHSFQNPSNTKDGYYLSHRFTLIKNIQDVQPKQSFVDDLGILNVIQQNEIPQKIFKLKQQQNPDTSRDLIAWQIYIPGLDIKRKHLIRFLKTKKFEHSQQLGIIISLKNQNEQQQQQEAYANNQNINIDDEVQSYKNIVKSEQLISTFQSYELPLTIYSIKINNSFKLKVLADQTRYENGVLKFVYEDEKELEVEASFV